MQTLKELQETVKVPFKAVQVIYHEYVYNLDIEISCNYVTLVIECMLLHAYIIKQLYAIYIHMHVHITSARMYDLIHFAYTLSQLAGMYLGNMWTQLQCKYHTRHLAK